MREYPSDTKRRTAERKRILEHHLAEARQKAARFSRSMKCSGEADYSLKPLHAQDPGGCANNGSTCLCECHDQPEGAQR